MKTSIKLHQDKQYIDGQTDGMKQYIKRSSTGVAYTYAANIRDARLHFKSGKNITY